MSYFGPVAANGVSAVYKYDLGDSMMPIIRCLFSYTRQGIADRIQVDDSGCVSTADGESNVL